MQKTNIMSQSSLDSYPPLFRQKNLNSGSDSDDEEEEEIISAAKQALEIEPLPVIDFQCINKEKLSGICRDWGIFRLVNHGIPLTLLDQLHEHAKKLFGLGFESKQSLFSTNILPAVFSYFWGTPALTPSGVPLQRGSESQVQGFNWVETLNVPLSQLSHLQVKDPLLHSFRLLLEEYGNHQSRLTRTIFQVMAEDLKLCPEHTKSYLSPATGVLRVYRYPRCARMATMPNKRAWGIDVHTDSSVLSILNQDQVGGLQLYKDDVWLDVKPIPNTLIVHLGDMIQAMSDDNYKSVKHRVKVHKHKERISIGYFVFPAEDAVIQSSTYKPFTYTDFRAQVQEDLSNNGFKVGLQRFKAT